MNYNDDLKVVWLTPQKTGTRSCGPIMFKIGFESNTLRDVPSHDLEIPVGKENYYLVMNVRNPYDRVLSLYSLYCLHAGNNPIEFEKWINDKYVFFKYKYSICLYDMIQRLPKLPDYYVKMENFGNDIKSLWFVKENLGSLSNVISENIKTNRYKSESKFRYNQYLADIVYNNLKKDFDLFGYNKNSWKNGTP